VGIFDRSTRRELDALREEVAELRRDLAELRRQTRPTSYEPTEGVVLGKGARVHPTCVLIASEGRTISIGPRTLVRRYAEMVGPITIGEHCSFNRNAYIRANTTIGDRVNVGAFARFITDTHEIAGPHRRAGQHSFPPITVGDGVFIGAGVTILGGVTIGDGAVVAAGSVVNRDVPPHTLVAGVPARPVKQLPLEPATLVGAGARRG